MEITKKEANTILELTAIAWGEGLGSEGDNALMERVIEG